MERTVTHRDRQELQSLDLNNMQAFTRATIDRLTGDAVADGYYYTGLTPTETGTWEITLTAGRFYANGAMYRRAASTVLDLFNDRPLTQKKVIAITAWGQTIETDVQPRDFLIDAELGTTEPQSVAMESLRSAEVSKIAGTESASPSAPAVPSNNVLIALVTLSTSGIESIEIKDDNVLPQSKRNGAEIDAINEWRQGIASAVDSLRSDMALFGADLSRRALRSRADSLETRIAALESSTARNWEAIQRLGEELSATSTFLLQEYEDFSNDAKSDTDHVDYDARVGGGLFFPYAASDSPAGGLALLNPTDPKVTVTDNMMSPKRAVTVRKFQTGVQVGEWANTQQYSVVTHTKKKMTRWTDASHYGSGPAEYRYSTFTGVPGVEWNAQSNRPTHAPGYAGEGGGYSDWRMARVDETAPGSGTWKITWVKVYEKWEENHYYVDETTETTKDSQGRAQTILNANGGWLQNITFKVDQLAAGDIDVLVCACDEGGYPDLQRILSETTVLSADVKGENIVPINPVYVNPGEFFAVVIMTTGAYRLLMAEHSVSHGQHYALTSANSFGVPGAEGDYDLYLELDFATYDSSLVYVDLQPLSLSGGIDSVGFNTDIVVPPNCAVHFEVQYGGSWYRMQPGETTAGMDWSQQPNLLPFRAVFKGTKDAMPAIGIGPRSSITVGRAATSFVHISEPIDVGAGNTTSEVRVRYRIDNFDDTPHDLTISLIVGGSPVAASAVSDVVIDRDSMHRTAVFNGIGPTQAFQIKTEGSVSSLTDMFTVIDRYTYAAV